MNNSTLNPLANSNQRETLRVMVKNMQSFTQSKPLRNSLFAKDKYGITVQAGDLVASKTQVYEVSEILLDDSYGWPLNKYCAALLLSPNRDQVFQFRNKANLKNAQSNHLYELAPVDMEWTPPYLGVLEGAPNMGNYWNKPDPTILDLVSRGYMPLRFQANRVIGRSIEDPNPRKVSLPLESFMSYGRNISKSDFLESRANLDVKLSGDWVSYSK